MFARLMAFAFVAVVLGAPLLGLASFIGNNQMSGNDQRQGDLCLTKGIGCGPGHALLLAFPRN